MGKADVVLCVFTKRLLAASAGDRPPSHIPSTYVLTEAGYALGRYENSEGKYVIGFVEKDVDMNSLGLFREQGTDLVPFDRAELPKYLPQFESYLKALPDRVRFGSAGGQLPLVRPSYRQLRVKKHVRVYRRGTGTTRIRCTVLVGDADRLRSEGIVHRIWNYRSDLPSLAEMLGTHFRNRTREPFFTAVVTTKGNRRVNVAPEIEEIDHSGRGLRFRLTLPKGLNVRLNDTIEYQYAWGHPHAFARTAEEMESHPYDTAAMCTSHGPIREAELYLEFEREARGLERVVPFLKEPFMQLSSKDDLDGPFSSALPLPETDESLYYLIYRWTGRDFYGTIRVSWIPVSKAVWLLKKGNI